MWNQPFEEIEFEEETDQGAAEVESEDQRRRGAGFRDTAGVYARPGGRPPRRLRRRPLPWLFRPRVAFPWPEPQPFPAGADASGCTCPDPAHGHAPGGDVPGGDQQPPSDEPLSSELGFGPLAEIPFP